VQDKEARFWRDSNVPIEPRHRRRQDLITSLTSTTMDLVVVRLGRFDD
jgi:hypothetical protein